MKTNEEDLGLETLLEMRAIHAASLDENLLRQCYAIQKKHQFNSDGSEAAALIDRLIDEAVKENPSCQKA